MSLLRPGVRLAVDVGTVRVGVAASDPDGLLAAPVETVRRSSADDADLERVAALAVERAAIEVVVGLPRSLTGREGPAAAAARRYAGRLAARLAPLPVRLVDERLSTVTAQRDLRIVGVRGRDRRAVVDQAAAVVILQSALETERRTGRPPGEAVDPAPPAVPAGTAGTETAGPRTPGRPGEHGGVGTRRSRSGDAGPRGPEVDA